MSASAVPNNNFCKDCGKPLWNDFKSTAVPELCTCKRDREQSLTEKIKELEGERDYWKERLHHFWSETDKDFLDNYKIIKENEKLKAEIKELKDKLSREGI